MASGILKQNSWMRAKALAMAVTVWGKTETDWREYVNQYGWAVLYAELRLNGLQWFPARREWQRIRINVQDDYNEGDTD